MTEDKMAKTGAWTCLESRPRLILGALIGSRGDKGLERVMHGQAFGGP